MVHLKSVDEIEIMRQSGRILMSVKAEIEKMIQPGVSTLELDKRAKQRMKERGGTPGFMTVPGYTWALCVPVNDQLVHTPPSRRPLKKGDVLTVDMGVLYKGFHSDYAFTVVVGNEAPEDVTLFLETGKRALKAAIRSMKQGAYIGDISLTIQKSVEGAGYSIVKELTGHGIGKELHEAPFVPGFLDQKREETEMLRDGIVLAIEIIYTMGRGEMVYQKGDSWSIVTKDHSVGACFEKTVAIVGGKASILT